MLVRVKVQYGMVGFICFTYIIGVDVFRFLLFDYHILDCQSAIFGFSEEVTGKFKPGSDA